MARLQKGTHKSVDPLGLGPLEILTGLPPAERHAAKVPGCLQVSVSFLFVVVIFSVPCLLFHSRRGLSPLWSWVMTASKAG